MIRQKNRFYELTPKEQEGEKINDIYRLISQQEETMAQILSKYQDKGDKDSNYPHDSRTIDHSLREENAPALKRGKSASKLQEIVLELPAISGTHKLSMSKKRSLRKSKDKHVNEILYSVDLKPDKNRSRLKDHLKKAYGTDKLKSYRSKSTFEVSQKQLDHIPKFVSEKVANREKEESRESAVAKTELPVPLGYLRNDVEGDSSSEEGDVPLAYYEKEFRQAIRAQCLQETNFLYFSKNESMKDWTEGLLLLFEKHDKQLQLLRRKCKYLQKFDESFFTIDIYRDA